MQDMLSVRDLNRFVKQLLDANDILFDIAIKGEISNFVKNSRSGHCYFTLKDENASVKAVMFKSDAQKLGFAPENGMQVVVRCRVTLYERDGAYQLYVTDVFPAGIGAAQMAFEQLKAKLEAEGLFAGERKKTIPYCPKTIGIVTSKTGAALQDIINVLSRRWPMLKVVLAPVRVQGFEATAEIAQAITKLDKNANVDTIIVARGGGSKEDLWVFNAETIARAAAACETPLISAIGHEIDFTILDFVADLRAPTPSAAAELCVPDVIELKEKIYKIKENIQKNMQLRFHLCYNIIKAQKNTLEQGSAKRKFTKNAEKLANIEKTLQNSMQNYILNKNRAIAHNAKLTDSLSPYRTLARGYAMIKDENDFVCGVDNLQVGQNIQVVGGEITAKCLVQKVEKNNEKTKEF